MKSNIALLTLFTTLSISSVGQAADWKCGSPAFTSQPAFDGDIYTVQIAMDCRISKSSSRGIPAVYEFLLRRVQQESHVLSGPSATKYAGLPGKGFKTQDQVNQGGDPMTVWNDYSIVTDGSLRAISATRSTQVRGSGSASYVRYLDSALDVKKVGESSFAVRVSGTIQVQKPFLVPKSFIEGPTQEAARAGVASSASDLLPRISEALE